MDPDAWRPNPWQLAAALAALALCLAVRAEVFRETLRYTLQGAALLVVFAWALQDRGRAARLLGSAPLRLVALLSYKIGRAHV